jgi:hypothetical protein
VQVAAKPSTRISFARGPLAVCLAVLGLALAGCGYSAWPDGEQGVDGGPDKKPFEIGGYKAGFLQPANVHTVYVQVFSSQEYRREIEYRLTEAIEKNILDHSPYRIGKKDQADTILTGELKSVPVTLLGSDLDSSLPQLLQVVLVVDWTWKDRRTGDILHQERGMEQAGNYIPLANETSYTGTGEAINRMAKRIVERMESPW